ncbi:methyl-accepting chemotaxis protein [Defluviitoga tunisiensis]|uniref:Methyl-accepting chemotaxis protein n=1 Tax=Defluviitoga tunisiensis TaxID=1006576 RepID=A0A0C7NRY5_DEFTU|nr:methyl-accepting chemotaxis protein [Defluviitoga tunisiensis]CEP78617.1 methyl-accepting chemotaxis protein [Defluviitoga tunisiensis]
MNFFEASVSLKDFVVSYDDQDKELILRNINNIKNMSLDYTKESTSLTNLHTYIENYEKYFNQIIELNNLKNTLINQDFINLSNNLKKIISDFKTKAKENNISTIVFYCDSALEILENINSFTTTYFVSESAGDKNSVLDAFNNLVSQLSIMEYGLVSEELEKMFTNIQSTVSEFRNVFDQIVEAIESQDPIIQEMEQLRVEILNLLEDQRAQLKEQQDTLGPQLIEKNNNSILLTIILTVIAFVVAIIMVIYLIRSITKPLLELRNKINQFKEGDLTVDFQVKSKDEIGQMALALSEMSKELRNSMGSIRQASGKVQESSVNLTKTSQESRENSEELKRQMDTIQTYAEETAGNVEEVTSGVDEVARAAQGVSRDAQRLSEEAENTNKAAQEGSQTILSISEIVKEAVERTKESQEEVTQLATNRKRCTKHSRNDKLDNGTNESTSLKCSDRSGKGRRSWKRICSSSR